MAGRGGWRGGGRGGGGGGGGEAGFCARPLECPPLASISTVRPPALIPHLRYTFSLIARVGVDVGAQTYYEAWAKAVSERSSILVSGAITFMTCAACLSYAIIIGDSFSSIATLAGAHALGPPVPTPPLPSPSADAVAAWANGSVRRLGSPTPSLSATRSPP